MDMKERMDALVKSVPEDKRKELVTKLFEAETIEERTEIAKSYVSEMSAEDAPEWLSGAYELSDEDLDQIAGGAPWDNEISEYGCY